MQKMKLTLGQRFKILFTGKISVTQPTLTHDRKSTRVKRACGKYAELAKKSRQTPTEWVQIAVMPLGSAHTLASRVRRGGVAAFRKPRGGVCEARITPCMSEYVVEMRFIPNKKENKK